jgi:phenylacetate-coenzyme A ligase PaaK-like adenylate-forming protein
LSQATAREALERGDLLARHAAKARLPAYPTSGTGGRAVWVPRGPAEQRRWRAAGLQIWLEHGYRWSHVTVPLDSHPGPAHPLQRLGLSRTRWISMELTPGEQARRVAEARADVVVGTPTVLRRLADAVAAAGLELTPAIVFCQGEVLDSGTTARLEDVLGVAPAGLYGLTELGYVGWQCPRRDGYHVNAGTSLVEVVRDGRPARPGEIGSVLVTDLRGRTAPLLRYDTGDLAVGGAGPCACGRPALLGSLEGRAVDVLRLPGGRLVSTRAVMEHMAGVLPPERYRVHQDEPARFRLYVDGGPAETAAAHLRRLLGDVEVEAAGGLAPNGTRDKSRPVTSALLERRPRCGGTLAPSEP